MKTLNSVNNAKQLIQRFENEKNKFLNFFETRGYLKIDREPIVPLEDKTILLTNSAIVPFKRYLGENSRELSKSGIVVTQPCLRAQNLKLDLEEDTINNLLLSFNMVGALVLASEAKRFAQDVEEYLLMTAGFDKENIYLDTFQEFTSSNQAWSRNNNNKIACYFGEKNKDYYYWKFGVDKLTGRGSTFRVHDKNGFNRDLANWIEIVYDGKIQAYGFGFGVEILLSCQQRMDWIIKALPGSQIFPIKNNLEIKVLDLTTFLLKGYHGGLREGSNGPRYLMRKSIKQLVFLLKKQNNNQLSESHVIAFFKRLSQLEQIFYKKPCSALYQDIEKYLPDFNQINQYDISFIVDKYFDFQALQHYYLNQCEKIKSVALIDTFFSEQKFGQQKKSITVRLQGALSKNNIKNIAISAAQTLPINCRY